MMYAPSVIETTGRSSRAFDLPTKLLQDRIVYLGEEVNEETSNSIIMQLLWLNADAPDKDIDFYINSPGGSVYDGLAIKDVMDNLKCKVNTIGLGMCASMGAYLLSAGTGERKATKNCRIMIHSVSSGTRGTIHDIEIDYKETKYLQDKLMQDITDFSKGKSSLESIIEKSKRDCYMSPEEAIELGLIDTRI
jgi:ATP-dependent Clp protease, protease subunit